MRPELGNIMAICTATLRGHRTEHTLKTQINQKKLSFLDNYFTQNSLSKGFYSSELMHHFNLFSQAALNGTLKLWSYNLAYLVKLEFFDNDGNFQRIIIEYFGKNFWNQFVKTLDWSESEKNIVLKICHEYLRTVYNYLQYNNTNHSKTIVADLDSVKKHIEDLKEWSDDEINRLRITELKSQLKLDYTDITNCEFWARQVQNPDTHQGGEELHLQDRVLKLPARVQPLFATPIDTKDYFEFLNHVNIQRKKTHSLSLFEYFREKHRTDTTKAFYESDNIELLRLRGT